MRLALKLHPDSRCTAVTRIEADLARPSAGNLTLRYTVTGRIDELRLPPVTAPARTDGLWRHTCFEMFVAASRGGPYFEFNFSPSSQWAAYRFTGYRAGMSAAKVSAPRIETRPGSAVYALEVSLPLGELIIMPCDSVWRLGLSAVIEEANGNKSYWALAHPSGQADFHHSDCFAQELPAAWRP